MFFMVVRIVALLFLIVALGACRPTSLFYITPEGPREYQLGWQDGCDTGLSAHDTFIYKIMYGFKKRPEFGNNDQYKTGWNEGFSYCRFSIDSQSKGWGE
jgi:hypothetical protein